MSDKTVVLTAEMAKELMKPEMGGWRGTDLQLAALSDLAAGRTLCVVNEPILWWDGDRSQPDVDTDKGAWHKIPLYRAQEE